MSNGQFRTTKSGDYVFSGISEKTRATFIAVTDTSGRLTFFHQSDPNTPILTVNDLYERKDNTFLLLCTTFNTGKGEQTYLLHFNPPITSTYQALSSSVLSVYPNPARERLTITLNQTDTGPLRWRLRDALGRTLREVRLDPAQNDWAAISLEGLAAGACFWEAVEEDTGKVVGNGKVLVMGN